MNTSTRYSQTLSPKNSAHKVTKILKDKKKQKQEEISLADRLINTLRAKNREKTKIFETIVKAEDFESAVNSEVLKDLSSQTKKDIIHTVLDKVDEIVENYLEKLSIQEKKTLLTDIIAYISYEKIINEGFKKFLENINFPQEISQTLCRDIVNIFNKKIDNDYKIVTTLYLENLGIKKVHTLNNKLKNHQQGEQLDKDIIHLFNSIQISEQEIDDNLSYLKKVVENYLYKYYSGIYSRNIGVYRNKILEEIYSEDKNGEDIEKKHEYKDGFGYILSSSFEVVNMIQDLVNKGNLEKKSFLDIGCGIPIISQTMKDIGCKEVAGLEYNKMLVEKSKPYFPEMEIYHDDMLKFSEYDKYDILYTFNPLKDRKLMLQALCHIIQNMKIGATLYFNNVMFSSETFKKSGYIGNGNCGPYKYTKTTKKFQKEFLEKDICQD